MPPAVASILLFAIVSMSLFLMLLRPRKIAEVWWVGSGVLLLLLLRLIPFSLAGMAVLQGLDVYLFLIGMMLLSEVARKHGVFDWLSSVAARRAQGSSKRLFALVYGVGTLTTVAMSNDATAVVLTPAVLSAIRKAEVDPTPYLFACAMIANAASFALPISNPANLVVYHSGMPRLQHWLSLYLVPSVCSIAATYAVLRWQFHTHLGERMEPKIEDAGLQPGAKLVLSGLLVMVAVLLTASALGIGLGLPACVTAIGIAATVSFWTKQNPLRFAKAVSWSALLLVAGLFVMVDAVESHGALHTSAAALKWVQHLPASVGVLLTGSAVGVANNLVNNLPLGLLAGATLRTTHPQGLIASAVLIGVDLGPNLSVTGSLATILWLLAMRKEEVNVSAWKFFRVGLLAMPAALLASLGGLLLMHVFVGG